MRIQLGQENIINYVREMHLGNIYVDVQYQRHGGIWTNPARSYFMDTIYHGYPMPKLTIRQAPGANPRDLVKREIVDGQQRSLAIREFLSDQFKLADTFTKAELRGLTFSQLNDDDARRFTEYLLPLDILIGATDEETRHMFRRINTYTAKLSAEEIRHAEYQGDFKWWAFSFAEDYADDLLRMGALSKGDILRMKDQRFIAELVHALDHEISTTKPEDLNTLYADNNTNFTHKDRDQQYISHAIRFLSQFESLFKSRVYNQLNFYALIIAVIAHDFQHSFGISLPAAAGTKPIADVVQSLDELNTILDDKDTDENSSHPLVIAQTGANVRSARESRIKVFYNALYV